ncbi:hypothetical protein HNQ40_003223 [Algisphaera agarilytica]|uniref:Uncharacterized protein n=2 Tax=Algisphaera agarilytica TaxID=1385975 RepID=A0A7X0LLV8_9BACT|nr:hypothetical protein [Algisphaera agarilytica]
MNNRISVLFMLAATMTMGLVVGLNVRQTAPVYAQAGVGGNYVVEEISSEDEDDDDWKYNGRTLAVVSPGGTLKLVHITWKRERGDDEDFPKHFAESGKTYNVTVLDASASLSH